ncbi:hypothetical protein [Spiroplasma endosymbiont of Amphimallon solstitiale]|uniref:hypothetical protein n=1 Tax=Spiroplasma endosymbiont of Amphimallon solstitiale TaxID=3066288 RepID=UPI00313C6CB6
MVAAALKKHQDKLLIKNLKIRLTKNDHYELKTYCYERNIIMNDFVRTCLESF